MKYLTEDQIREMKNVMNTAESDHGERIEMMKRYEEIYFMTRNEKPKGLGVDENDLKVTISSAGRDAAVGLNRILNTSKIHVKVKGAASSISNKIEDAMKKIVEVSGQYRQSSIEKDINLSTVVHGPGVLLVEDVDDLIEVHAKNYDKDSEAKSIAQEYVLSQLTLIKEQTPMLLRPLNAMQSFPVWGEYGMIGHLWKYKVKGNVLRERWGATDVKDDQDYEVRDLFYYGNRLVVADGCAEPLMACEWVSRDKDGKIIASISIPVFSRWSGGSSLFHEPHKQMQPLLYAKAKGEWDLRENLYWTYLFTALYTQGLPGPLVLVDPDNSNQTIEVNYQKGVRYMVAKGTMVNNPVIDGDVIRIKELMDGEAATQTIQPQTLGQNTAGVTFSQFALASRAGLIPAQDPKEAQEALYKDVFTHILARIKHEGGTHPLLSAADIPDKFELEVVIEPDLAQDDLRNAQIANQLRSTNSDLSNEWINTHILHISNSDEMFKQKTKEDFRNAMVQTILSDQEMMKQLAANAMGMKAATTSPPANPSVTPPSVPPQTSTFGEGSEAMPQTDAMVLPEERQ